MKEELDASQQIVKVIDGQQVDWPCLLNLPSQIAFTTHLRILWGAQDANAILDSPPDGQIQAFQSRFTNSKEVAAATSPSASD
jgi:hypothetical protein